LAALAVLGVTVLDAPKPWGIPNFALLTGIGTLAIIAQVVALNIRQTSADLLRTAPGYVCPIRNTLSTTAPIPRGETHGPYTPGYVCPFVR
jgi:hypothetical protein